VTTETRRHRLHRCKVASHGPTVPRGVFALGRARMRSVFPIASVIGFGIVTVMSTCSQATISGLLK
jgi:hypothetical protein